jgi:CheY-like chemotaxis protein
VKNAITENDSSIASINRPSTSERDLAVENVRKASAKIVGKNILWIDDHPRNNRHLVRALQLAGMVVTQVTNDSEAKQELSSFYPYDLIISDISRGHNEKAGIQFLQFIKDTRPSLPVIFFITRIDRRLGIPDGVVDVINRSDTLLNTVVRVLSNGSE